MSPFKEFTGRLTKWAKDLVVAPEGRIDPVKAFLSGEDIITVLSRAGVKIDENEAVKVAAVYACVNLISNHIGTINTHVFRRKGRGKERALEHPLYEILRWQPNPEMTALDFKKVMQAYRELWGNAYAEVERNRRGDVVALWPIPPDVVAKKRDKSGDLFYQVRLADNTETTLPESEMFHLRGFGNGVIGCRFIELARGAISLAMATEDFGSKFFEQGAVASGIVEMPGKLSDKALEDFKRDFREKHQGLGKSHRVIFLEQGLKFHQLTIPNDNAQFLESRKFQVEEVARMFGVPLHKIAMLDKASFNNIEHQGIEYVQDCLEPRCAGWEQECRRVLLEKKDRKDMFVKFNLAKLMRGDAKTRGVYYQIMRQNGVMSANDIRELEDLDPLPPGKGGDEYLVNGNMVPINRAIVGGGENIEISQDGN